MYLREPSTGITRYGRQGRGAMGDSIADLITAHIASLKNIGSGASTEANTTVAGSTSSSTITAADFNSTKVPGVCKPLNFVALEAIKRLQRQLNRTAQVKGFTKIAIDGDIGSATLGLLQKVQVASGGAVMGDTASCNGVAPDVDVIGDQAEAFADSIGAPAVATGVPKPASPPSIVDPKTLQIVPQGAGAGVMDAVAGMPTIMKVGFIGILGGIGYFAFGFDKKRKKGR